MPRQSRPKPPARGKSVRTRGGGQQTAVRKRRRPASSGAVGIDQPRDDGKERLQKTLASAGVASRRESEQMILEGRVQVDGEVVMELGARVDPHDQEIRVDGEILSRPKRLYFAVHKPTGVVSTARDPAGRPRVIDLLPKEVGRVFNVGRLDLASEGLILVTNDGELANRLTHPRHGVQKEYEVQVAGQADPEVLAQLKKGVHLAEGKARALHVRIKSRRKNSTLLTMVLDEGRNREIRRILARIGHKVQRLTRVAVGPIRLGELPRGAVRPLTSSEVRKLRSAATYSDDPAAKKRTNRDGDESTASGRAPAGRKRKAAAGKNAVPSDGGDRSSRSMSRSAKPKRKQRGRR